MAKSFEAEVKALGDVLGALVELDEEQREFVLRIAAERVKIGLARGSSSSSAPATRGRAGRPPREAGSDSGARAFVSAKAPRNDVQRVAVLAAYLHKRGVAKFKTPDIKAAANEAGVRLPNPAQSVANATALSHLLAPAGGGKKQLSSFGQAVVAALPDQSAVREASKSRPGRKKSKPGRKSARA